MPATLSRQKDPLERMVQMTLATRTKLWLVQQIWFIAFITTIVVVAAVSVACHSCLPANWASLDTFFAMSHSLQAGEAMTKRPTLLGLAFSLPTVLLMAMVAVLLFKSNEPVATTFLKALHESSHALDSISVTVLVAGNESTPCTNQRSLTLMSVSPRHA